MPDNFGKLASNKGLHDKFPDSHRHGLFFIDLMAKAGA
jgi:hypothetical protein